MSSFNELVKLADDEHILYKFEKQANKWTLIRKMLIFFIVAFVFLFPILVTYDDMGSGKDYFILTFAIVGIYSFYKFYEFLSDYLKMPESLIKYYKYLVFTNKGIHSNLHKKVFYPWDKIEHIAAYVFDDVCGDEGQMNGYYLQIKFKDKRLLSIEISKLIYNGIFGSKVKWTERFMDISNAADNSFKAYKKLQLNKNEVEKEN